MVFFFFFDPLFGSMVTLQDVWASFRVLWLILAHGAWLQPAKHYFNNPENQSREHQAVFDSLVMFFSLLQTQLSHIPTNKILNNVPLCYLVILFSCFVLYNYFKFIYTIEWGSYICFLKCTHKLVLSQGNVFLWLPNEIPIPKHGKTLKQMVPEGVWKLCDLRKWFSLWLLLRINIS